MNIAEFTQLFRTHPLFTQAAEALRSSATAKVCIKTLCGSLPQLLVQQLFTKTKQHIIVCAPDSDDAAYVYGDATSLCGAKNVLFFPSSYKRSLLYNQPDRSNMLLRTEVLEKLSKNENQKPYIIVTSPEALVEQVITKELLQQKIHFLSVGEQVDTAFINELLYEFGFERVDFVLQPGQFSVRGSIIDIFSFSNDVPYRVDFFGNEVDSIRTFDCNDQRSIESVENFAIVPNIQSKEHITHYTSFLEYCSDFTLCISDISLCAKSLQNLYEQALKNPTNAEVSEQSLLSVDDFLTQITLRQVCEFSSQPFFEKAILFDSNSTPQPAINKNFELFGKQLVENQARDYSNFFITQSITQYDRIRAIFDEINPHVRLTPIVTSLHKGFIDHDSRLCCYTDHEIFERYHSQITRKKVVSQDSFSIQDIKNLSPGDFVVHIDHGIGKFAGLERLEVNGNVQETVKLVYKDNDVVYVGIHNLHKISKYKGKDGTPPTVHKLGSAVWQNTKQKTKNKVKDIAKELIALYAERKSKEGFRFSPDSYLQQELEASFFFEDTPDQSSATQKVKQAMEAPYPMDMLVCGDVGFGKTEVAIRAAFKAVCDGKQVAVLVPTTILAMQHYKTFSSRLQELPCTVDYICRLRSTKQQKETLENLKQGKTDILIGTHRLIGKDILFKDLGLLIIDEEQKFGVSMKEKLKRMKVNVDSLTLTATPIPRTLQFSLMGARDLAIINTPPPNRHPILTEVHTFNPDIIQEAILYEVNRGGQVFVVNNRIKNIYELETLINKLCPKVRTVVGHGQMDGETLEQIMLDFMNHEYDVLLATTIIESGLDIPNANTIIVNDAHNFGLSDLHQLRGRVGRSNKKAYCYLLAPPSHVLTKEARQRLQAIEEYSDLGSGFNIAMQDLDIRGAGNMLGAEQSGFISDIGYETYQKILDEALLELRETEFQELFAEGGGENAAHSNRLHSAAFINDCHVETDLQLFFPESYIESTKERVKMYRELDTISNEEDLQAFEEQLRDRFGEIPAQSYALLDVVRLRWIAISLGIERITLKNNTILCYFVANQNSAFYQSPVFESVLSYVQHNPKRCTLKELKGKLTLRFDHIETLAQAIVVLKEIQMC